MKKYIVLAALIIGSTVVMAQDRSGGRRNDRQLRKEEKKARTNAIVRQEEEGVLSYNKHNAFGLQLRSNGYGVFYERGKMTSPRWANIYGIELTEIMHPKEERSPGQGLLLGNSYKFGKVNNFYQAKLGYGRQYIFGQKGNKNGVAVIGSVMGGLSMGLLKPYYLQVNDNGDDRNIRYTPEDSSLFLSNSIIGSSGFTKGWNEVKLRPGAYVKTSLRFDFGSFNESISALEIGFSAEGYAKGVEQMLFNKPKSLFYQAHVAMVFGNRR